MLLTVLTNYLGNYLGLEMWCDMAVLRDGVNAPAMEQSSQTTSWIWMFECICGITYEMRGQKAHKDAFWKPHVSQHLNAWGFADDCFLDRGKGLAGVTSDLGCQ